MPKISTPLPHVLMDEAIQNKIDSAPELASLRRINNALGDLLKAEMGVTSQIAEIIRRDPSLTSRLLKLVNSALFTLEEPVHSVEEAVLYLGLRHIKQLAIATPIIEDLQGLSDNSEQGNWEELWQHSIATAILSREILSLVEAQYEDDTDYIVGLIHNLGHIVIGSLFPEHFAMILEEKDKNDEPLCSIEKRILGWDHAAIGAYYLKRHGLSKELAEATAFHNEPEKADKFRHTAAAVQVADHLARSAGILGIERTKLLEENEWPSLSGWKILFGEDTENYPLILASLRYSLEQLPSLLKSMV